MQRRWTVKEGPEFDASLRACEVPPERLKLHLDAFKLNLEWDPFLYSHPFDGDSRRAMQTNDYVGDGFILTAYVVLYKDFVVEIKWIEASPLPEEELEAEQELEQDVATDEQEAPEAAT